jgi:two-component system response regulator DevR
MKDRKARPILVVIVDDHEMVRLGLKTALGRSASISVIGEAASIAEAWTQLDQQRPDVVLLDVRLPDGNGVVACRDIRARFPDTHVLFLTSYSDEDAAVGAVFGGAAGYLMKDITSEALIEAIQKVAAGQIVLDPSVTQDVLARMRGMAQGPAKSDSVTPSLSVQEEKVLALIAEGLSNKEIATQLDLSEKTVTNYVYRLYKKIQVKRRSQAARYFLQHKVS